MHLRTTLLSLTLLAGLAAFAQPTPPYIVIITGQVIPCDPSSFVNIYTTQNTLPDLNIDVPLDANCGFTITLTMDSPEGWFAIGTNCQGAMQYQSATYTAAEDSTLISVVFNCGGNVDCEGTPGGSAWPGTPCTTSQGQAGVFDNSCTCISNSTVPSNDACNAPTFMPPDSVCFGIIGDLAGATYSGVDPESCDGYMSSSANDVWFAFVATADSAIIQATGGPGLDLILEVFTDSCGMGLLDCSDTNLAGMIEEVMIATDPGSVYYYRLYPWNGLVSESTTYTTCVISTGNESPDCEGVAGGTALPGTACVTVFGTAGTWDANCGCVADSASCNACFTTASSEPWVVSYGNCSSGTPPFTYNWQFPDGSVSDLEDPIWSIPSAGQWVTCLTIADMNGCTSTVCDSVILDANGTVDPTIVACQSCFVVEQATDGSGEPIPYMAYFNGYCTVGMPNYLAFFDYGDGTTDWALPHHTYPGPGVYIACLTITDAVNCTSTFCDTVVVDAQGNVNIVPPPPCEAAFFVMQAYQWVDSAANPNGGGGEPIPNELWIWNLSGGGTGNFQFLWSFGDGSSSTEPYPSHTYASSGTYELCLTIADNAGCTNTYCQSITVDSDGIYNGLTGGGSRSTFTIRVMDPMLTGVTEVPSFSNLSAWPNPVSDVLNVNLQSRLAGSVNVTITDLSGRIVTTTSLGIVGGDNRLTLPTAELNAGLYLMTINNGSAKASQRFVKVQ